MNDPRVVVISDSRWKLVRERALKLFPEATICAPESQQVYRMVADDDRLLFHPDLDTTPRILRWLMNTIPEESLLIVLDDYTDGLWWMLGEKQARYHDPSLARALLETSCRNARDLGCGLFGFNSQWDIRRVDRDQRFSLTGPVGNPIGIIGRDLVVDTDYVRTAWEMDLALQSLSLHRKVYQDLAWHFQAHPPIKSDSKQPLPPGDEAWNTDMKRLKQKWGHNVTLTNVKGVLWPEISVRR